MASGATTNKLITGLIVPCATVPASVLWADAKPAVGPSALFWQIVAGVPMPCPFEARCRLKTMATQMAGRYAASWPLRFVASYR